jgi:hypothetical protein
MARKYNVIKGKIPYIISLEIPQRQDCDDDYADADHLGLRAMKAVLGELKAEGAIDFYEINKALFVSFGDGKRVYRLAFPLKEEDSNTLTDNIGEWGDNNPEIYFVDADSNIIYHDRERDRLYSELDMAVIETRITQTLEEYEYPGERDEDISPDDVE